MNHVLCFAGNGCLGCSHCGEEVSDLEREMFREKLKRQKEEELRAKNFPTLKVPLSDFLRGNGCGRPLCNGNNGNECICAFNPY